MTDGVNTKKESIGSDAAGAPVDENLRGTATSGQPEDAGLSEKQAMVEKLFRHTNAFLAEHRQDPLLVVEALAAILVRYAALLGPVEQMPDRLAVLERLVAQECAQIQAVAKAAEWNKRGK